jgi:hypothetical protein
MKRVILITALMFASATTLISCKETKEKETVVREVEVERTEPVEEREGILERAAKKADERVNKEIDEEIERIGDDN